MASLGTDYIIRYLSDISGAVKGAKDVENINKQMANSLAGSYAGAVRVVGQNFDKLSSTTIKLPDGSKVEAQLRTLGTTIVDANGKYQLFTRTLIDGKLDETSGKLSNVTNAYRVGAIETEKATKSFASFAGQSSRLATNLNSVSDVNSKLAPQLKNFGSVTEVVSKNLVSSGANYEKYNALLKTTDGTYLKLTETISRTPDGIQKVKSSIDLASSSFVNLNTAQKQVAASLPTVIQPVGRLGTDFQNLASINANFSKELSGVGNVVRVIRPSINELSGDTQKVGVYAETTSGKFVNLKENLTKTNGAFRLTKATMTETSQAAANGNNVFANWATSIGQLASRALLTIPIWLALRAAVTGVMAGISGGFGSMIELDKALNKARVAAGGTIEGMKKEMATLKPFMEKLSVETGQSIKDLGDVFFSFRSTGLDFQTSMAGMEVSNKIARSQMGDVKKVAESLAKVILILGDSFESGGTSIDKMNKFAALSYELNTKNAFSIDQLTESMITFAPSAKAAGLSAEQSMKIMATVLSGGIGVQGGRTMSTGLSKFITNFKELTPLLGIKVDPKVGTFNALMMTLDALKKLNAEGTLNPAFTKAINDLFGGERGGKTVKSLISIYDVLKQNVGMTGDVNKLNAALEEVNKSIQVQSERFAQLRDSSWRAFMVGILGGEDFQKSLKEVNSTLEASKNVIQGVGLGFNWVGKIINNLTVIPGIINAFTNAYDAGTKKNIANTDLLTQATAGLKGELDANKLQEVFDKLVNLKIKGKLSIGDAAYQELASGLQNKIDEIASDNPINIKAKVTEVDTSEISNTLQKGSEQEATAKILLENSIDQLKQEGATTSEILKATQLRTDQLKIFEDGNTKLGRQLQLERAINQEKRLQGKLSSDTIKLYDIAKTNGVDAARKIGDVLAGNTSFETFFAQGGENLKIFEKQFGDLLKQKQAEQFVLGKQVSGEPGLQGGFGIAIQEEKIRRPGISSFDTRLAAEQSKAESKFGLVSKVVAQVNAPINTTVNVNIDAKEQLTSFLKDYIKDNSATMVKDMTTVGTPINKALVEGIFGKGVKNS